ncbi:MAG: Wzz/FepE/Etk N-terminal domain-containing protein [bacterium]|nr:Wzz/FepE/Etk N-terminal domain-containing protein [bacterium]
MDKKIELIDYIRVLFRYRKLIFWNTFIVTVFALIISFVIPKKYTATTSLLPPLPGTDILSNMQTSMFGNLRGIPGLTSTTSSDLFAAILKSNTVIDSVITECKLMKVYKTKTFKDTRKRLICYTSISISEEGIVGINTTADSPKLAKIILDSYIKNLDLVNKNLVMSTGKRNRIFVEKRLEEVKNKLKSIEDSLCKFQELHKTISIQDEIKPVLEGIADIKAKIISNEVTLGMLREYATEENPEVVRINSESKELNNKLHKMEYEKDNSHFGIGFSVPLNNLPEVSLEMARLIRDVLIQEKVLSLLTEQYELARSQEIKDTPTINILEPPTVPEKKSFPKRSVIISVAFILSFFISIFLAFFFNWINNLSETEQTEWKKIFNRDIQKRRG